jgi:hypothetical protein
MYDHLFLSMLIFADVLPWLLYANITVETVALNTPNSHGQVGIIFNAQIFCEYSGQPYENSEFLLFWEFIQFLSDIQRLSNTDLMLIALNKWVSLFCQQSTRSWAKRV